MSYRYTKWALRSLALSIVILGSACSSQPSVEQTKAQRTAVATAPASDVMVMALYKDQDLEVRVIVEDAFCESLATEGLECEPGFRHVTSYQNLEARKYEIGRTLAELEIGTLIMIDPIRAVDFDPSEYENRRAIYQSMGMDASLVFASFGQLTASADASKYVMQILVWDRQAQDLAPWRTRARD